jgi:hypothetical protein
VKIEGNPAIVELTEIGVLPLGMKLDVVEKTAD